MQFPFAVIPLAQFVSNRRLMGSFVIGRWTKVLTWGVASLIVSLNGKLLIDMIGG
ncbi:hypothetical protein [Paraburkholderia caribensis]|uniref:hypothetical protein n=1 Tax=Paraburkholderia caribensis TaxID=75105 RepID=UPI0003E502F3|nr:hypothetical protein [Paraburkholderia caribensis]